MATSLPKPVFVSCDETSLTLKCVDPTTAGRNWAPPDCNLFLEFKEPPEDWSKAGSLALDAATGEIDAQEIVDLKPGTPYFVRIVAKHRSNGQVIEGPETVFDTKPVDCTPKKKKCTIM